MARQALGWVAWIMGLSSSRKLILACTGCKQLDRLAADAGWVILQTKSDFEARHARCPGEIKFSDE